MFCITCGKQIPDQSSFCQFCGKAVVNVAPKIGSINSPATSTTTTVNNPLLSIGDLFTKTWEVFSKVWLTALIVAFIGILIQTVVKKIVFGIWGVSFGITSLVTLGMESRFFISNILFNLAGLITIWTAFLVIHFWMQTAIIYIIKNQEEKDKTQAVKNALKQSWQAMGPISIISLLSSFFTGIGFIFLILPGIFLMFMWQYATLSYIFDGKKGMDSLNYSWSLVIPQFWDVLGRNLLFGIGVMFLSILFRQGLFSFLKDIVIAPLWITYSYILYNDLGKNRS